MPPSTSLACAPLLAWMGRLLLPGRALRKLLNGAINSCLVWPSQSSAWVPSSLCPLTAQILTSTGYRWGLRTEPNMSMMCTMWLWARRALRLLLEARRLLRDVSNPTWFFRETGEAWRGHTAPALSVLKLEAQGGCHFCPFPSFRPSGL